MSILIKYHIFENEWNIAIINFALSLYFVHVLLKLQSVVLGLGLREIRLAMVVVVLFTSQFIVL